MLMSDWCVCGICLLVHLSQVKKQMKNSRGKVELFDQLVFCSIISVFLLLTVGEL